MINLIAFIIATLLWFYPLFRKLGKENRLQTKWYVYPMLTMAVPMMIVTVILQSLINRFLIEGHGFSLVVTAALISFGYAGLLEELMKFLSGKIYLKRSGASSRIDYIFLFGAAGMGFQLTESLAGIFSLMGSTSPIVGLYRGLFPQHVFLLMFSGALYYDAVKNKGTEKETSSLIKFGLGFLLTVILHGLNDFGLSLAEPYLLLENLTAAEAAMLDTGINIFLASVVLNVLLIVVVLFITNRAIKAKKAGQ